MHWVSSFIKNLTLFTIVYGFGGGTSQGALLIIPIYCCWRYFDAVHKPKVSGVVLSAYALAPLFTSYLAFYAINPNNAKQSVLGEDGLMYFDTDVAMRVPYFLRLFGTVCPIVGYIGTLFVLEPLRAVKEEDEKLLEIGKDNKNSNTEVRVQNILNQAAIKEEKQKKLDDQIDNIAHVSLSEALSLFKKPTFISLYVIMIICYIFPHLMNFTFKSIGLQSLKNDAFVTFVGSLAAIMNAISRIIVGLSYQKLGYLPIGLTIVVIQVIISLTYLRTSHNKLTYLISTCAFELTYGGQAGLYPLLCDHLFKKKGGTYYAFLFSSFTVSVIISLNGYTFLNRWYGQWVPFIAVAIIALCSLPFIFRVGKVDKDCRESGSQETITE